MTPQRVQPHSARARGPRAAIDLGVALRAVRTSGFMTADWAELPAALPNEVSSRIINEVRGINRAA